MKFFNEIKGHSHYDLEYGKLVEKNTIINELKYLLQELTEICNKNEIKIIIMHGSLIGWHFNKKILPYDDDIDVCILEEDLIKFIKCDGIENENFIIKINPNFINRNINDRDNVIDARIISKKCGVFIDITFLTSIDKKDYYNCKSPHYYHKNMIKPLKKNNFENCEIYIPNQYKYCLFQEYGKNVLKPFYKKWKFINNEWEK